MCVCNFDKKGRERELQKKPSVQAAEVQCLEALQALVLAACHTAAQSHPPSDKARPVDEAKEALAGIVMKVPR